MHKILMIEDDTATRDALERHLSRWGYQVRASKKFSKYPGAIGSLSSSFGAVGHFAAFF